MAVIESRRSRLLTRKFLGGLHGQLARRDEDDGLHALSSKADLLGIGSPKAAVLPVPVWDCAMMSFSPEADGES